MENTIPIQNQPVAPMAPEQNATVQPDIQDTSPNSYDTHVANRDAQSLVQIAQANPGTEEGQHAFDAASTIVNGANWFQNLTKKIDESGGANTSEGRLHIAEAYKTVADNPQWGTALLRYVMGDKQGAVNMITGGDVKTLITYDNGGNQIIERVNALGEPVSRIDAKTNKPIDAQEYAQRVGGISSWANTLAGKTAEAMRDKSLSALVKNTEAENKWATTNAGNALLVRQLDNHLSQLKDINPNAYAEGMKYVNGNLSNGAFSSNSKSLLNNWNNYVSNTAGQQVDEKYTAGLGLKGIFTADGKGGIVDSKGQTITRSGLEQQQNTNTASLTNDQKYSQDRESLLKYLQLNPASKDPEKAKAYQNSMMEALRLSNEVAKNQAKTSNQYEVPGFMTLPSAFGETDQPSRGRILVQQHLYNEDAMKLYKEYYDAVIKNYPPERPPLPQEIERQFVKTPEFQALQNQYYGKTQDILNEKRAYKEQQASTKSKSQAVAPPVTNTQETGATKIDASTVPKPTIPPAKRK